MRVHSTRCDQPVKSRSYRQALRIIKQAREEAQSSTPHELARAMLAITEREIGDGPPRWSLRRLRERLTYDVALRVFVFAIGMFLAVVAIFGIFG